MTSKTLMEKGLHFWDKEGINDFFFETNSCFQATTFKKFSVSYLQIFKKNLCCFKPEPCKDHLRCFWISMCYRRWVWSHIHNFVSVFFIVNYLKIVFQSIWICNSSHERLYWYRHIRPTLCFHLFWSCWWSCLCSLQHAHLYSLC